MATITRAKLAGWIAPRATPQLPQDQEMVSLVERQLEIAVAYCRLVTKLHGPSLRRAYCADLADGRRIKVRQMWDESRAREIEQYLLAMNGCHFPRLLARSGTTLLLEWIDGDPLDQLADDPDIYLQAGRLLAQFHASEPLKPKPAGTLLARLGPRVQTDVRILRSWSLITPAQEARLLTLLRRDIPGSGGVCLVHGDSSFY